MSAVISSVLFQTRDKMTPLHSLRLEERDIFPCYFDQNLKRDIIMKVINNSDQIQSNIRVVMLGGFVITSNDINITEHMKKSSKLLRLTQYLIINRHRVVPQEELIEVFSAMKPAILRVLCV